MNLLNKCLKIVSNICLYYSQINCRHAKKQLNHILKQILNSADMDAGARPSSDESDKEEDYDEGSDGSFGYGLRDWECPIAIGVMESRSRIQRAV